MLFNPYSMYTVIDNEEYAKILITLILVKQLADVSVDPLIILTRASSRNVVTFKLFAKKFHYFVHTLQARTMFLFYVVLIFEKDRMK